MGVVHQPVEDGVGQGGLANHRVPVLGVELTRHCVGVCPKGCTASPASRCTQPLWLLSAALRAAPLHQSATLHRAPIRLMLFTIS